jgi:anti-anti-sigma regulatory factor
MLKITIYDGSDEFRLRLEGKLSGPWVKELRQCWQTASSTTEGRSTVLDLREVDFVDSEGEAVLREMRAAGVKLVADTPVIQAILREVCRRRRCGTVEESTPRTDAVTRKD